MSLEGNSDEFNGIQNAGFVNSKPMEPVDDLPTAMEAEVYVDGKLQIKNKKKNGKSNKETLADKKKKEMQQSRNFSEICSIFRGKKRNLGN